jgi:hypothetical protein
MITSSKAIPSLPFWRKRSTKTEPREPPVIRFMNLSNKSEACRANRGLAVTHQACKLENMNLLAKTNISDHNKENEPPVIATSTFGQIQMDEDQSFVEVTIAAHTRPPSRRSWDIEKKVEQVLMTPRTQPNSPEPSSPNLEATDDSTQVPSNLEILEDLRNRLISETLQRRMALVAASSSSTRSSINILTPDDSLVKPPKKPPTKSFVEYRREIFGCDEKYDEIDPPEHLIPGEALREDAQTSIPKSVVGKPEKTYDLAQIDLVYNDLPKPIIPGLPATAKKAEDVAMHEILTAINLFVSPEYEPLAEDNPSDRPIAVKVDSDRSHASFCCATENMPPEDASEDITVVAKKLPLAKDELDSFTSYPRSRSHALALRNVDSDECPEDETTGGLFTAKSKASLEPSQSGDESSLITPTWEADGLVERYRYNDSTSLARKIDFSGDSKSNDLDDGENSFLDSGNLDGLQGDGQNIKVRYSFYRDWNSWLSSSLTPCP